MVSKNFFLRFLISTLLFLIYLISLNDIKTLIILILVIYAIIFYEVYKNFKNLYLFILTYLSISLIFLFLYLYQFFDIFYFNLLVFVIITFDSFSYLVGKFFGKTIVFTKISPKKTLEGYLGGLFFTNIIFLIYINLFQITFNLIVFILLNLLIVTAFMGDLIQSFFKRKNFIKDSSNYLPGHGGFFDRFDSFIFAIIFLYLFKLIIS